ncbi:SH3 domain-containing protein 21 isoform X2 [Scleropages formosus]|uniref:SH3 domain-containing protein 21 isoform X2 n=1 Tax=Scleropages formosus TaxID=113540 RepID=UPI000877FB00|nr:SH3 domain-containing protein 21 isoform X2 [Scleropages formosus]
MGKMADELTLHVGDLVKNVTKTAEEGWLEGELRGKRGVFPANFVKEVPTYLIGGDKREPRSLRKSRVVKTQIRKCEVAFAYNPMNEDELDLVVGETIEILREIEDGWWLGRKNGKIGAFPSNFVKEIFVSGKDSKMTDGKNRPKLTDSLFKKEIKDQQRASVRKKTANAKECYQVMFDYKAVSDDELDLKKGDVVRIISKETEDEGWWEGDLNGHRGFFPDNFVMMIPTASTVQLNVMSKPPARCGAEHPPATLSMEKAPPYDNTDHDSKNETKEEKVETKDLRSDPPNKLKLPGLKKAPPPPLKDKPKKPGDVSPLSPRPTEDKTKEWQQFDIMDVSSAKLTHPTANRAKPPQRRPPTNMHTPSSPSEEEKEDESSTVSKELPGITKSTENHLPSPTHHELVMQVPKLPSALNSRIVKPNGDIKPSPKPSQNDSKATEDIRAEVRELSMALDLLKTRHEKDIEELKEELREERVKRMALQDEVQLLKKTVNHH